MVTVNINDNLVRLINGEECWGEDTFLFSKIEIHMADFDAFNDDHVATITLPEPAPVQNLYEFESDVILHVEAVVANRGSDGETLFLTVQEI
jgi:hypothetical protein